MNAAQSVEVARLIDDALCAAQRVASEIISDEACWRIIRYRQA